MGDDGRQNCLGCLRYGYRSRHARYLCAGEKNNLSVSRERRCFVVIVIVKKWVMGIEEVDLADAENCRQMCGEIRKRYSLPRYNRRRCGSDTCGGNRGGDLSSNCRSPSDCGKVSISQRCI